MEEFSLIGVMAVYSLLLAMCTYLMAVFGMLFSFKMVLWVISAAVIIGGLFFCKKIISFDSVARKYQFTKIRKKPKIHSEFILLEVLSALMVVTFSSLCRAEKYSEYLCG
ncbi:MAG: hypothetical protein ACEY3J_00365 [Arsenophonus sp.]